MTSITDTTNRNTIKETTMRHQTRVHHGLGLRTAGVLAAIAVTALMLLVPKPAAAGEYYQYFCNHGAGSPQANAWYGIGHPQPSVHCNPGAGFPNDGVYYNTASLPLNGYGGLRADAPPGARYASLSVNLRVPYQAGNRRTFIEANNQYVWNNWNGWGGTSSFNGSGYFFTTDLQNSGYFAIGQACHGAVGGCEAGDFYFSGMTATLTDNQAPSVVADPVGIFEPGRTAFRGLATVQADITDSGHGPGGSRLQVDGIEVAYSSVDWNGGCNFRLSNPCPPRLDWTRTVNTASYPDGIHVVRMVADDGVGQAASTERAVTFDNTAPVMGAKPAIDGKTVTADAATFDVSATDATTGVARLERRVDQGPWENLANLAAATVTITGTGTRTVRLRAVDRVDNVSPETVVTFTLQAPPENQRITTVEDQPLPGAPGVGDVIKCHVGAPWSEGTTFTYRWLRDGDVIDGATSQTYTVVAADAGGQLVCQVTATNEAGTTERASDPATSGSERCFGHTAALEPCGDFDGDGVDNGADTDDDNDGTPDADDPEPFNPNVPAGGGGGGATGSSTTGTTTSTSTGATGARGADGANAAAIPFVGPPNNGTNASNKAKISVEGSRRRTVRYGRRIATVAYLRDENGRPIAGAQVTVMERMKVPGAQWVPARAPLVTDSAGRMRWLIPAKYSRTIQYAYKANLANTEFQSTSDVVLTVFSKSTLKPSRRVVRNGRQVAFTGRLLSKPLPRGGVLIDLQARIGSRWQTFKTGRTRGNGRWRMSYRFVSTHGVRTYAFRARVRQDSGYPYALSTTRPIKVKVVG